MMLSLEIPREVPVMTLSGAVLFPQAIMPLHIFEPRYRLMLKEVLQGERIFAVAALDEEADNPPAPEPACSVAGVGIVRACRKNTDGSAHLILQGLARVEFENITAETPFRRARIHQLASVPGGPEAKLATIKAELLRLVQTQIRLGSAIPEASIAFLDHISEPEIVLDLAIYALCPSTSLKQELLETRGILPRYQRFRRYLRDQIEALKLDRKLKGMLGDDAVGNN